MTTTQLFWAFTITLWGGILLFIYTLWKETPTEPPTDEPLHDDLEGDAPVIDFARAQEAAACRQRRHRGLL